MSAREVTPEGGVLLEVRDLKKYFPIRKGLLRRVVGQVKAVDGVSFSIRSYLKQNQKSLGQLNHRQSPSKNGAP